MKHAPKRPRKKPSLGSIATQRLSVFGPPALIDGETETEFYQLLEKFYEHVKPENVVEEMLVRDTVDLVWEISRYRRLKAALLQSGQQENLAAVLCEVGCDEEYASQLAAHCVVRDPNALGEADMRLSRAGQTVDSIHAKSLSAHLDAITGIERLIASADVRCKGNLDRIENCRERLRVALQHAIANEKARVIEHHPPAEKDAA